MGTDFLFLSERKSQVVRARRSNLSGVFAKTKAEAALVAGIFHREEVLIEAVKGTHAE